MCYHGTYGVSSVHISLAQAYITEEEADIDATLVLASRLLYRRDEFSFHDWNIANLTPALNG